MELAPKPAGRPPMTWLLTGVHYKLFGLRRALASWFDRLDGSRLLHERLHAAPPDWLSALLVRFRAARKAYKENTGRSGALLESMARRLLTTRWALTDTYRSLQLQGVPTWTAANCRPIGGVWMPATADPDVKTWSCGQWYCPWCTFRHRRMAVKFLAGKLGVVKRYFANKGGNWAGQALAGPWRVTSYYGPRLANLPYSEWQRQVKNFLRDRPDVWNGGAEASVAVRWTAPWYDPAAAEFRHRTSIVTAVSKSCGAPDGFEVPPRNENVRMRRQTFEGIREAARAAIFWEPQCLDEVGLLAGAIHTYRGKSRIDIVHPGELKPPGETALRSAAWPAVQSLWPAI